MTVREVIEALREYPPDAECVIGVETNYNIGAECEIKKVCPNEDKAQITCGVGPEFINACRENIILSN